MMFKTIKEALKAGYSKVQKGDLDISGPNSFGYQFQRGEQKTEMIFLSQQKSRMGHLGAYCPMFTPNGL